MCKYDLLFLNCKKKKVLFAKDSLAPGPCLYFGSQISIEQIFSSTFCYSASGTSRMEYLSERQKQLYKKEHKSWQVLPDGLKEHS